MRFVFDENHPSALARMIAVPAMDEGEAYTVTHVVALGLRGKPDTEVVAAICADGTRGVLVTTDRAMRRRSHEKAAVAKAGAIVVVGVSNWNQQSQLWDRARMMLWWWPTIVRSAGDADPGSFLELPWRQTVKPLVRWRV